MRENFLNYTHFFIEFMVVLVLSDKLIGKLKFKHVKYLQLVQIRLACTRTTEDPISLILTE